MGQTVDVDVNQQSDNVVRQGQRTQQRFYLWSVMERTDFASCNSFDLQDQDHSYSTATMPRPYNHHAYADHYNNSNYQSLRLKTQEEDRNYLIKNLWESSNQAITIDDNFGQHLSASEIRTLILVLWSKDQRRNQKRSRCFFCRKRK